MIGICSSVVKLGKSIGPICDGCSVILSETLWLVVR